MPSQRTRQQYGSTAQMWLAHESQLDVRRRPVEQIGCAQVEPPPNVFAENEITYVTGVGKLNNRLIILVDLQKVLTRGELRRIGEALEEAAAS